MSIHWYYIVAFVYLLLGFIIVFGSRKDDKRSGKDYKMNIFEWFFCVTCFPGMLIIALIAMMFGVDQGKIEHLFGD